MAGGEDSNLAQLRQNFVYDESLFRLHQSELASNCHWCRRQNGREKNKPDLSKWLLVTGGMIICAGERCRSYYRDTNKRARRNWFCKTCVSKNRGEATGDRSFDDFFTRVSDGAAAAAAPAAGAAAAAAGVVLVGGGGPVWRQDETRCFHCLNNRCPCGTSKYYPTFYHKRRSKKAEEHSRRAASAGAKGLDLNARDIANDGLENVSSDGDAVGGGLVVVVVVGGGGGEGGGGGGGGGDKFRMSSDGRSSEGGGRRNGREGSQADEDGGVRGGGGGTSSGSMAMEYEGGTVSGGAGCGLTNAIAKGMHLDEDGSHPSLPPPPPPHPPPPPLAVVVSETRNDSVDGGGARVGGVSRLDGMRSGSFSFDVGADVNGHHHHHHQQHHHDALHHTPPRHHHQLNPHHSLPPHQRAPNDLLSQMAMSADVHPPSMNGGGFDPHSPLVRVGLGGGGGGGGGGKTTSPSGIGVDVLPLPGSSNCSSSATEINDAEVEVVDTGMMDEDELPPRCTCHLEHHETLPPSPSPPAIANDTSNHDGIETRQPDEVVVVGAISEEAINDLKEFCRPVLVDGAERVLQQEVAQKAWLARGMILMGSPAVRVTEGFLAEAPSLEIIAVAGSSAKNIDVDACSRRGVWVTTVPDKITGNTAFMAFGLLLDLMLRIREGDCQARMPLTGSLHVGTLPDAEFTLEKKVIGFLGLSDVVQAIVKKLSAFDIKSACVYDERHRLKEREMWGGIVMTPSASLPDVLAESDIIFVVEKAHASSPISFTPETLKMFKKGSYLVNADPNLKVDEESLVEALEHKILAGYASVSPCSPQGNALPWSDMRSGDQHPALGKMDFVALPQVEQQQPYLQRSRATEKSPPRPLLWDTNGNSGRNADLTARLQKLSHQTLFYPYWQAHLKKMTDDVARLAVKQVRAVFRQQTPYHSVNNIISPFQPASSAPRSYVGLTRWAAPDVSVSPLGKRALLSESTQPGQFANIPELQHANKIGRHHINGGR